MQSVFGECINYHTPVRHEHTQVFRFQCCSNDDPYNTNPICFAGLVLNLQPQQNEAFFQSGRRNKFYRLFSAQLIHASLRKAWPLVDKKLMYSRLMTHAFNCHEGVVLTESHHFTGGSPIERGMRVVAIYRWHLMLAARKLGEKHGLETFYEFEELFGNVVPGRDRHTVGSAVF